VGEEEVMICPLLTVGAWGGNPEQIEEEDCRGSRCARWVQEYVTRAGIESNHRDPNAHPTGCGWCADNLHGESWDDPARGE